MSDENILFYFSFTNLGFLQKALMEIAVVFRAVYRNTTLESWYYAILPRNVINLQDEKAGIDRYQHLPKRYDYTFIYDSHLRIHSELPPLFIFCLNSCSDIPTCLRNSLWKLLLSETPTIVCTDDVGASSSLSKRIASFRRTS